MTKPLHPRPNLDHLKRQAKALLAALPDSDDAARTLIDHLPAAEGMTVDAVRAAGFRLADAQYAIARREGFASWPRLAQYIAKLRAMEGSWRFAALEVDGMTVPAGALTASRLLIDGDRFCMQSPEATYDGVFSIDVDAVPHRIDVEFVAGPEAGNWSYGLFEIDGDDLRICLGLTGVARPTAFATAPGSGHALERLRRVDAGRPDAVTGGTPGAVLPDAVMPDAFEYHLDPELARLEGEWRAVELVMNGMALPPPMLAMARRFGVRNEVRVTMGDQVMLEARIHIMSGDMPVAIDYWQSCAGGAALQLGIMQWLGDEVRVCMAPPGQPRPEDFACPAGSGRILSRWRPA